MKSYRRATYDGTRYGGGDHPPSASPLPAALLLLLAPAVLPLSGRLGLWTPADLEPTLIRCAPKHTSTRRAAQGVPCPIAPDFDRGRAAAPRSTSLPRLPLPDKLFTSLSCHLLGRPLGWFCLTHLHRPTLDKLLFVSLKTFEFPPVAAPLSTG